MASISYDRATGRRTIQFVGADGRRHSIRLGRVAQRQAEAFKIRLEDLIAARVTGYVPREETLLWLSKLDDETYTKLSDLHLAAPRKRAILGPFLSDYVESRKDVKPATQVVYGHTCRNLISFFGKQKEMGTITPGDADRWALNLSTVEKLSHSTLRRRSGIAKQFFRAAVRLKLISENPFRDIKSGIVANPARMFFISREIAEKVLAKCPDAEWRLLFALSRYGGLRCPSEHLNLRWTDVDWEKNRMLVHSPKTEHHIGGESRWVPIFPELLPYLREVFELATEGTEYVITRYRRTNMNLRTQLLRIIRRAGVKPWPKLFQNLRSTRETELAESWPLHVACAWIGNSQIVAARHYLQVTDEHFLKAAGGIQSSPVSVRS